VCMALCACQHGVNVGNMVGPQAAETDGVQHDRHAALQPWFRDTLQASGHLRPPYASQNNAQPDASKPHACIRVRAGSGGARSGVCNATDARATAQHSMADIQDIPDIPDTAHTWPHASDTPSQPEPNVTRRRAVAHGGVSVTARRPIDIDIDTRESRDGNKIDIDIDTPKGITKAVVDTSHACQLAERAQRPSPTSRHDT
jgi:alkylhydroperoxidase family enzyme